jgi:hypothetical protein
MFLHLVVGYGFVTSVTANTVQQIKQRYSKGYDICRLLYYNLFDDGMGSSRKQITTRYLFTN